MKSASNRWENFHEDDTVKVKEKQRKDGGTEYLHIYKDPSLSGEAASSRAGQNHDHVAFSPDGSLKYDSTQD